MQCFFFLFENSSIRDIVQYLKLKAGPIMEFVPSISDIVPYLAQLEILENFERGRFAVAVAVFLPTDNDITVRQSINSFSKIL